MNGFTYAVMMHYKLFVFGCFFIFAFLIGVSLSAHEGENKGNIAWMSGWLSVGVGIMFLVIWAIPIAAGCDMEALAGNAAKFEHSNSMFSYQKTEPVKEIIPAKSGHMQTLVLESGQKRYVYRSQIGRYIARTDSKIAAGQMTAYLSVLKFKPRYQKLGKRIDREHYYTYRVVIKRYKYVKPERFER